MSAVEDMANAETAVPLDSVEQFVSRSRAEQGLPPHVEDPEALARIVTLLTGEKVRDN